MIGRQITTTPSGWDLWQEAVKDIWFAREYAFGEIWCTVYVSQDKMAVAVTSRQLIVKTTSSLIDFRISVIIVQILPFEIIAE